MFSLHDFVLSAVTGMIGNYPDWQVQEYALGWYSKKVLAETDLAEIGAKIAAQYPAQAPTDADENPEGASLGDSAAV